MGSCIIFFLGLNPFYTVLGFKLRKILCFYPRMNKVLIIIIIIIIIIPVKYTTAVGILQNAVVNVSRNC